MSSNEYFMAWSVYAGCAFFVIVFWFWATSIFRSLPVRLLLRLPVIAILLTPVPHALDGSLYVPVVASVAFEFLSKDSLALSESLATLLAAVLASVAVALLLSLAAWLLGRFMRRDTEAASS